MNKFVYLLFAALLFGPVISGFASGDAAVEHSNRVTYVPSTQR